MNSALASLTAQYTDSDNEEENEDSDDSHHSQASQVIIPPPVIKKLPVPQIQQEPNDKKLTKASKKKKTKKVRRLVSYQDDTILSDEEPEESSESSESSTESESEKENSRNDNQNNSNTNISSSRMGEHSPMETEEGTGKSPEPYVNRDAEFAAKYAHYGFTLPPEPKGQPPAEVVEKINRLHDKMKSTNMDMNRLIQDRKDFRNPSIYEKLIHFCDINEFGTNYPPEVYDPLQWGAESFYEELARVQKNEMIRRQKEKKDTDKIEQATALARKVEEEAKKRKSKWDQPGPLKSVQPPLTTTVTGTKGTVISAFGTLPKRPMI